MAAVGFLDYAYKLLTGEIGPPLEREGTGPDIDTINKFSDQLQEMSKKTWDNINQKITLMNTNTFIREGDTIFTPEFRDDMRKITNSSIPFLKAIPQKTVLAGLLEQDYKRSDRGLKYVFKETDDKTQFQNFLGDIQNDLTFVDDAQYTSDIVKYSQGTFIDPYIYSNHAEDVPHSASEVVNNYQYVTEKNGYVDKIMAFISRNPDKFDMATISKAFRNEQDFMKKVEEKWNDPSLNRAISDGDAWGAYTTLFNDGLADVKQGIVTVGDNTLGSDISPVKPFWDLFKNLWDNAGSYIEIVLIVGAVFALLWAAGEVKYISKSNT